METQRGIMGDYTKKIHKILRDNGCYFVRSGKGDHKIWYSPIINSTFSIDGKIKNRIAANEYLKNAGINRKV